jgi:hypothetical protein
MLDAALESVTRLYADLRAVKKSAFYRAPLKCVRENWFSSNPLERIIEVPAPEGRPSLAQRFSAGKSGRNDSSPGGTTQFSRTL